MGYYEEILMETSERDLIDLFADTSKTRLGPNDRYKTPLEDLVEAECNYNETIDELRRCYVG